MSDINRNTQLVDMTAEMRSKHRIISVNEKISQINSLKQRLDDLKNVEAKKLELKIEYLEEEIKKLKAEEI